MNNPANTRVVLTLAMLGSLLTSSAYAQNPKPIEPVPFERNGTRLNNQTAVKWKVNLAYASVVLTVATPAGEVIRREFQTGQSPSFTLVDDKGSSLSDGQYQYELRLTLNLPARATEALAAARERELQDTENETTQEKSNSAATQRELVKSGILPAEPILLSGAFTIAKGVVYLGNASDRTGTGSMPLDSDPKISKRRLNPELDSFGRNQAAFIPATMRAFDQVIPDDLIVQGSACVGFDCLNGESFGFDTLRLKENNLRIKFEDTSTGAGFPSNDWQLTANDSASGGANKFSIEDITGARVPFTVTAGAATNSIFVDSTGRVGLRTSTPVLDLHVNTSNTPSHRLEQNNSGGFTAQTWDVAGNEANFFVRDVTGGSRLPFRIRPGAPTSSIDIAADGNVGIGTASPTSRLDMTTTTAAVDMLMTQRNGTRTWTVGIGGGSDIWRIRDVTANAARFVISNTGNIGLGGLTAPTNPIHHSNGAVLTAGGQWQDVSTRSAKMNIRSLSAHSALQALRQMNPVTFQYKAEPGEEHVGFIAEEVPHIVATKDRKNLSAMDIVAVLTKAVQEQQQIIADLKLKVERLEKRQSQTARRARK